jgi:hypothetical protein
LGPDFPAERYQDYGTGAAKKNRTAWLCRARRKAFFGQGFFWARLFWIRLLGRKPGSGEIGLAGRMPGFARSGLFNQAFARSVLAGLFDDFQ